MKRHQLEIIEQRVFLGMTGHWRLALDFAILNKDFNPVGSESHLENRIRAMGQRSI